MFREDECIIAPERLSGGSERGKETMNEETFQKKLAELVAEIGTLPEGERSKLEALANETKERHKHLKQTVSNLQESIDFLRLSIKYMLFDLEATRRENNYLRKMLEDNAGPSGDSSS
jgi:chromosome segregation ATPase